MDTTKPNQYPTAQLLPPTAKIMSPSTDCNYSSSKDSSENSDQVRLFELDIDDDSGDEEAYIHTQAEELNYEHDFDEDDTAELVALATYFQSKEATPTLYGLAQDEIAIKEKQ